MGLLFSSGKHRISRRISRKLHRYFTLFHAKDFWGFVWSSGGQTEFPISLGINSYISYQSVTWASGSGKFPNRLRSHVLSVDSDSKNANTCKYGSLICFLSGNSILIGSCRFQIQFQGPLHGGKLEWWIYICVCMMILHFIALPRSIDFFTGVKRQHCECRCLTNPNINIVRVGGTSKLQHWRPGYYIYIYIHIDT